MLPMAKPGLISVGIFNFLGQWNQYLLPTVLNAGGAQDKRVLTQGLVQLAVSQGYKGDWSALFAGLTIAMLPVLGVYIVFQRQVQAGLTAGSAASSGAGHGAGGPCGRDGIREIRPVVAARRPYRRMGRARTAAEVFARLARIGRFPIVRA